MKKLLPALLTLLGAYTASAQVGIGTSTPNPSAQLEIVSSDRGVLIPQVRLTSTTDTTTITTGNVQSLLVYNTATASDIKPGYYFWYINKWRRLVTADDVPTTNGSAAPIVDNGDGTYTYVNPNGSTTTIDIPGHQTLTYLVYNPTANTLTYTNENGINTVIDLVSLVKNAETVTTLVDNGNGTMTYTNEAGVATTVSVAGGAAGVGIASTVNNGDGTFTLTYTNGTTFTTSNLTGPAGPAGAAGPQGPAGAAGNGIASTVNNGNGTFTITYTDGTTFTTPNFTGAQGPAGAQGPSGMAGTPGSAGVGIASAVNNGNGTFTLNFTNGSSFTTSNLTGPQGPAGAIGATGATGAAGISAYQEWLNAGHTGTQADFLNSLKGAQGVAGPQGAQGPQGAAGKGITTTVNNGDGTLTINYTDGTSTVINFKDIETLTTFVNNGNGTYTYTNEDGVATTIDVRASAILYNNTTSGLPATTVQGALDQLAAGQTAINTSLDNFRLVDNNNGTFSLIGKDGTTVVSTINKGTITANADGTYTFNNGGTPVTIDPSQVHITFNNGVYTFTNAAGATISAIDVNANALPFNNTASGLTATTVQGAIDQISAGTSTITITDENDGKVTLVKADGSKVKVSKGDIIDNNDGTYTFTNGDGTDVTINANNLTITEANGVYTFTDATGAVIETIDTNASALAYDNTTSGLTATNVQAAIDEVKAGSSAVNLIDENDGKVTLVKADGSKVKVNKADITSNGDGTYTFTNGDGTDVTISANSLTITEIGGVYKFTNGAGDLLATIDTNASALGYNDTVTNLGSTNVQGAIEALSSGQNAVTLLDEADGKVTLVKADGSKVKVDKSDITDNNDGTYTFTNGDGTDVTISSNNLVITEAAGVYTFTDGAGNVLNTIDTNASALGYDDTTTNLGSTNVQGAIEALSSGQNAVTLLDEADGKVTLVKADGSKVKVDKSDITDNNDGTYTFTNGDGTDVTISSNNLVITEAAGVYTFTDGAGNVLNTIDTNASALGYDDTTTNLGSTNVQGAIEALSSGQNAVTLLDEADGKVTLVKADGSKVKVDKSDITDNNDGTYTFTNGDGTDVTISSNNLVITEAAGVYTFTDGAGNVLNTIDTNASALGYDNTTSGLTATNVQAAIDEVKAGSSAITLLDEADGKVTLVKADGTKVKVDKSDITDNNDGTYTFTNGDGTDVTISSNNLVITEAAGVYTFADANGNVLNTIDTNAAALGYDDTTTNLGSTNVQGAIEALSSGQNAVTLLDEADGKVTLVKADGSKVKVDKSDITDNNDGTYTFTNGDGTDVTISSNNLVITEAAGVYTFADANGNVLNTIDTNAAALPFDNTTSGLTATNVQAAIDEVKAGSSAITLLDEADGKVTLVKADGSKVKVDKSDITDNNDGTYTFTNGDGTDVTISSNNLVITEAAGVYTFADANGNVLNTIDTNASALGYDDTVTNLGSTNVQGAIEALSSGQNAVTLLDEADGKVTLVKADGTKVKVDKSDITDNNDGTYTFTNGDGTDVTISSNNLVITEAAGVYTFADANGNVLNTIDTNAAALPFDNTTSGLTATNVQAAIDEVKAGSSAITLLDEADGKVTLVKADGSKVKVDKSDITDNNDGTYTFTNGDGTDVTISSNNLVITEAAGVYTFADANGNVLNTIDTNASALGYDNTTSGLTATNVQAAIDEVKAGSSAITLLDEADGKVTLVKADGSKVKVDKSDITDNNDGTYTFTNGDGTDVTISSNNLIITEAAGVYTFADANGNVLNTIDTNAAALPFDNTTSGLTATNVQAAIDEVKAGSSAITLLDEADGKVTLVKADGTKVKVDKSDITDNNDGTYTFTNGDGTDVTISSNNLIITEAAGVYTFADANGNVLNTIDTNAAALPFDNTTSGLTATNVQAAIDEVKAGSSAITLLDEADGKVTLVKADGTKVKVDKSDITDNNDGTYTFTNGDGTDVTISSNNLVITEAAGVYTFADANGNVLNTIDTNAAALPFDNTTSGLTATNVQAAIDEVKAGSSAITLLDEADGKVTLVKADGSKVKVDKSDITDNNDGTYTFTNGDGTDVTISSNNLVITEAAGVYTFADANGNVLNTIDTNAAALPFDNTTSGLTATNVQAAIDEVKAGSSAITLLDEADGKVTLVKADGTKVKVDKSDITDNNDGTYTFTNGDGTDVTISSNNLVITEAAGVYTFADANGNVLNTIDTNASALGYDNTTSGLTATNVQAAIDEVKAGSSAITLLDEADGKVTLVKADGSKVKVDKSDITDNNDGTYTFTNGDGTDVTISSNNLVITEAAGVYTFADANGNVLNTIDTNAAALPFDNTVSGLTATNVQAAIDEVKAGSSAITLLDEADGKVTLVKADGSKVKVDKSDITDNNDGTYTFTNGDGTDVTINANNLSITEAGGIYTFTDATGTVIETINTNASALPYNNTTSGLTGTDVQGAIDEIVAETIASKKDLLAADGANATIEVVGGVNAVLADTSLRVKDNSITSAKITDGTITAADIASAGNDKVLTTAPDGTVTWADKTELAIEPWNNQNTTDKATSNASNIYQTGSIGIGNFSAENVSQKLDVKEGSVRVRDINASAGIATDKVVVADAQGVLKTVSSMPGIRTEIQNYSAVLADETILADAAGAAVTITLPVEPVMGKKYNIKKIDTSDNKVIISGNGKTIEGLASISGALPYQGWVLQYNGSSWFVISRI